MAAPAKKEQKQKTIIFAENSGPRVNKMKHDKEQNNKMAVKFRTVDKDEQSSKI